MVRFAQTYGISKIPVIQLGPYRNPERILDSIFSDFESNLDLPLSPKSRINPTAFQNSPSNFLTSLSGSIWKLALDIAPYLGITQPTRHDESLSVFSAICVNTISPLHMRRAERGPCAMKINGSLPKTTRDVPLFPFIRMDLLRINFTDQFQSWIAVTFLGFCRIICCDLVPNAILYY
ncbi:hypothetical protein DdX_20512 [Ditylenchus destructor]|uniref:Uncharacterized protein n=1 Tax=Ditylenchus destructor TaxID=166010 RepID=A0AAD4QWB1_9BILA|nr:hypothetical protein DdX_20512 [Ditylenchus destructor]